MKRLVLGAARRAGKRFMFVPCADAARTMWRVFGPVSSAADPSRAAVLSEAMGTQFPFTLVPDTLHLTPPMFWIGQWGEP